MENSITSQASACVAVAALPQTRATLAPQSPCIADDRVRLDNAAFADRVASLLARLGVGEGDVVAVALTNRVELVVALFAAWRLGAAATPVNPALTATEMQYQVDDAAAKVVIGNGIELDTTVVDVAELAAEPLVYESAVDLTESALALLIYTSGTTGSPKGVMLDHANIAAMCAMAQAGLGITAEDHSLLVLPLFHVNGIVVGTLDAAARRRTGHHRRALQPDDVPRDRRAGPPDLLLGGARDLRDAVGTPRGRDPRYLVATSRGVRGGADARGADRAHRAALRRRACRGLRAL